MPRQINRAQDITFDIVQHYGVLDKSQSGWTKEVNLVEWNGKPAKVDIREWDPEHEHMSRGITLRKSEALKLLDILLRNFGRELSDIRAKAAAEAAKAVEEIEASTASQAAADAEPIEPMEPMDEAETESMQSPF